MDRIVITGGAPLQGTIPIYGAKNSALKLQAAALLSAQPLMLENMPDLADTRFMAQLLKSLGVDITWIKDQSLTDLDNLPDPEVLAAEIIENLESGLEYFKEVVRGLSSS